MQVNASFQAWFRFHPEERDCMSNLGLLRTSPAFRLGLCYQLHPVDLHALRAGRPCPRDVRDTPLEHPDELI